MRDKKSRRNTNRSRSSSSSSSNRKNRSRSNNSRSSSSSTSSSRSSKSRSSINSLSSTTLESKHDYSDSFSFSSNDENDDKKSKRSASSLSNRSSKKSIFTKSNPALSEKNSIISSSRDSLTSSISNLSRANSLKNLEEEFTPLANNPYSVRRVLYSVQDSVIKIHKYKAKYGENLVKIKSLDENSDQWKNENEKLTDEMINESIGIVAIHQVVYGVTHWKLAWSHINLAHIYLEYKNLPKQAKHHCEQAWSIFYEDLKDEVRHDLNNSNFENFAFEFYNVNYNKHHTILNYVYGRSCTLLKENEEGEAALEKAREFYENWRSELNENKKERIKFKRELRTWRQKIYLALAKQYAINNLYGNAIVYYDKFLDYLNKTSTNTTLHISNKTDQEILVEVHQDKAKIELKRGNNHKAVDIIKEAIKSCEENGQVISVQELKVSLAEIYSDLDDMNSSSKAEDLLREAVDEYSKIFDKNLSEKAIKSKEDLAKFYLKQEKYDDACNMFNNLVIDKIKFYGDFSLKLNSTYKLLCSVYLKKNDMQKAAKFLQNSFEIEEINYGVKHQKTLATKETLDNLKKNPNVKIKSSTLEKPKFSAGKKIDYSKTDKSLYSNNNGTNEIENTSTTTISVKNKSQTLQKDNESDNISMSSSNISLSKKINPIK